MRSTNLRPMSESETSPTPLSDLAVAVRERMHTVLADGKPHPLEDFIDPDGDRGDAIDAIIDVIDAEPRFIGIGDDLVDLVAVLEGRVLTHVVTEGEHAAGELVIRPDLELPLLPFVTEVPLAGGGAATIGFEPTLDADDEAVADELEGGVLVLGDGGLACGAGETLAVGLRDGVIAMETADADPTRTAAASEVLAATFAREHDENDGCMQLYRLVLAWLMDDADALRTPHAPVGDLLAAAGLRRRGDWVGPEDADWISPVEREQEQERADRAEAYGFDECCETAYQLVGDAYRGTAGGATPGEVVDALAHGQVAAAFMATMLANAGHHIETVAQNLLTLADELAPHARGTAGASVLHLRSMALECVGRVVEAERDIAAAIRIDPSNPHALVIMAGYLEDRGEPTRALEHLHRAGVSEEYPQAARLARLAAAVPTKVGRNDPCPCGSGKKYKNCCIDAPALDPRDHVEWLYAKALGFMLHPARQGAAVHLAAHAVGLAGEDLTPGERLESDVRFAELAVFEEGGIEWYLRLREAMLPTADARLLAEWEDEPLVLMTIETVDADAVTVRLDGEEDVLAARTFSIDPLTAGMTLVGRLLEAHDELWLAGPLIEIPEGEVTTAREMADDEETASFEWAEYIGHLDAVEAGVATGPFARDPHHHHHHH